MQTLNELITPESAGVNGLLGGGDACAAACTACCPPPARCGWGGTGYARLRSACRRNRWNRSAGPTAVGAASGAATSDAMVDGVRSLPTSWKLWLSLGVPVADCGTSRYSVADAGRASWASATAVPPCDIRPSHAVRARTGVTAGWRAAQRRP